MVASLKSQYRLADLLQAAGLARSTFYYHQARLDAPDKHAGLKREIKTVFDQSHARYGHRRVRLALKRQGICVSRKLVAKLMKQEHLVCQVRKKKRYNSYRSNQSNAAGNVLNRDFTATKPNQKWVSDVTEFRVGNQKLYLSPIIDLYDHSVISYSISASPNLELTNSSLRKALHQAQPGPGMIMHTDQGFQYQHHSWKALLANYNATQSMSRKGNCHDNAMAENFFAHLKAELFYQHAFTNTEDLANQIQDYIHWYNNQRIQQRLEGMTPNEYRNHALVA